MNRQQATFQLGELIIHAKGLIAEIDAGEYDEDGDYAYMTMLDDLKDHLVLAWHYARMSNEQIHGLSQEQFESLITAIPKFNVEDRLVEPFDDLL